MHNMADKTNCELHEVFTVDPLELKGFIGRYVQLDLVHDINILGIIYTIDPVSQSIVLIGNEKEFVTMKIVLKNSVKSIKIIPNVPNDLKNVKISEFFTQNRKRKSLSEINKKKEEVKSCLLKNMITVEEKGDILVLDTLEIHPPYSVENCYCNNSIVLDRIQALLKNLKQDDN